MSDETTPAQPAQPVQPDQPAGPPAAYAPAPPRLRDRVLGARAVAAVALASLLLGGLGGAGLGALSDGPDRGDGRFGPGMGRFPADHGGPGRRPPPGQDGAAD